VASSDSSNEKARRKEPELRRALPLIESKLFGYFICADQMKMAYFGDALVPLETYDVSNN
jgi:hypothetical protein